MNKKIKIPVFLYHDADPASFERDLQFLSCNGIKTLFAEECWKMLTGKEEFHKSVVLTFDDCRASIWGQVYPLLKKYDKKCVLFVSPFVIDDKRKRNGFCSWEEIMAMKEEGVADVQNHSHEHELVFVSGKVVDFQRPGAYGFPMFSEWIGDKGKVDWGSPIFECSWKGAVNREFMPDARKTDECIKHVSRNGGVDFFKKRNWKSELLNISGSSIEGEVKEINFDRKEYLERTIVESQNAIYGKTGIVPGFFAPPVHCYDTLVLDILKEKGFHGLFDGSSETRLDRDGFAVIGRERSGAPRRLSGKGRETLMERLLGKIFR